MSVCPVGERIGGEDPLVCRTWYDRTPCTRPRTEPVLSHGQWYRWDYAQTKCEQHVARAGKCPSCRSRASITCPRCWTALLTQQACVYRPAWCSHPPYDLPPPKPQGRPCATCGKPGHRPMDHAGSDPTEEGHG